MRFFKSGRGSEGENLPKNPTEKAEVFNVKMECEQLLQDIDAFITDFMPGKVLPPDWEVRITKIQDRLGALGIIDKLKDYLPSAEKLNEVSNNFPTAISIREARKIHETNQVKPSYNMFLELRKLFGTLMAKLKGIVESTN